MLENSIMESCELNGNRQCGQLCSHGIDTMNFVSGVKNLSSDNPNTLLYKGLKSSLSDFLLLLCRRGPLRRGDMLPII